MWAVKEEPAEGGREYVYMDRPVLKNIPRGMGGGSGMRGKEPRWRFSFGPSPATSFSISSSCSRGYSTILLRGLFLQELLS